MRIHHIALRTPDVPRLAQFYVDVIGLCPRGEGSPTNATSVWLSLGEGAVLMVERCDASEPAIPLGSQELVAFAVSVDERESWLARLARAGVAVEARTEHTIYFRDPDGRRVAISSYPI